MTRAEEDPPGNSCSPGERRAGGWETLVCPSAAIARVSLMSRINQHNNMAARYLVPPVVLRRSVILLIRYRIAVVRLAHKPGHLLSWLDHIGGNNLSLTLVCLRRESSSAANHVQRIPRLQPIPPEWRQSSGTVPGHVLGRPCMTVDMLVWPLGAFLAFPLTLLGLVLVVVPS
jgi:hypothetical protein